MMTDAVPPCPACGNSSHRFLFHVDVFPIVRCTRCGLEKLHPQPPDETLEAIYDGEYQLASGTSRELEALDVMKRMTAKRYLETVMTLGVPPKPKLLEIGCGWGHFLSEAVEAGFDAHGVELSPFAAAEARKRTSPERVVNAPLEMSGLKGGSYDFAVMIDVIEHVRAPGTFIEDVGAMLKPGGRIFIVTPSTDSLSARIMRRHWVEYKPEHLFAFSKKSLGALLKGKGYADVSFSPAKKVLNLNFVNAYLQRFSVPVLSRAASILSASAPRRVAHAPFVLSAGGIAVSATNPG